MTTNSPERCWDSLVPSFLPCSSSSSVSSSAARSSAALPSFYFFFFFFRPFAALAVLGLSAALRFDAVARLLPGVPSQPSTTATTLPGSAFFALGIRPNKDKRRAFDPAARSNRSTPRSRGASPKIAASLVEPKGWRCPRVVEGSVMTFRALIDLDASRRTSAMAAAASVG